MQVNHKLPEIQGAFPKFFKTWVVLGPNHPSSPGQIKTVRISGNVTSALVTPHYTHAAGERVNGIKGITIHIDEEPNGTRFLKDLYEEWGRLDNWDHWQAHQKACEDGREVDPFPESRLPPVVLQWRQRVGSNRDKFTIPEDDAPALDSPKPQRRRAPGSAEPAAE
jgi:hypothetical protein